MVERSKNDLLFFAILSLTISACERKTRQKKIQLTWNLFRSNSPLAKKQTNPSNTFFIKAMIIPHINVKNPPTFRSENSRAKKKNIKINFSGLTQNSDLIYLLWKPKLPKCIFNSKSLFHKTSHKQEKLKFKICRSTVVTETLNA